MTVDLEFLIQKEGDFEWLPLESLSVEILVGRYQLIAQASEADCPIQVHIRHQYVQDGVWQEVVQQQLHRTDSQGRIEVLPPTFLQHGRWIISCSPQPDERFGLSEVDCHCVQLHVLTHDIDLDEEWEFVDPPLNLQPEPSSTRADDLKPLFTADISAKTAWNNFAPAVEAVEDIDLVDPDLLVPPPAETPAFMAIEVDPFATLEIEPSPTTSDKKSEKTSAEKLEAVPAQPELPNIPQHTPLIRFEISPGLILPPELFKSDLDPSDIPLPQLPVFPHLDHWADLSYRELSIALGRLYWSKLDTYGEAIDVDFRSLDLQTRFLQNLQALALGDIPVSEPPLHDRSFEHLQLDPENCKALIPIPTQGKS
ncbi:hypothetical protein [Acaryochloris sp. IP29b_bin.137]|uniref:hypothetical protein n=1 Tax=Acaryochloris sp. IP29b_bin.137 TaxID=2969217 RepID=UPI002630E6C8|nr:hypothetical protein [Acaryochloris sp. IP29b_bin.137]